MEYQQLNECLSILRRKENWLSLKDNLEQKLQCLEIIRINATASYIWVLFEFLKDKNNIIRIRTAETIIHLFKRLKSQTELYECLKHISINITDIASYKVEFAPDIYLRLLAIASLNKNGFVRENALKELATLQNEEAIEYILLRLSDWVIQVREIAQNVIRMYLVDKFSNAFLRNLPLIDSLVKTQRADLANIHSEIIQFLCRRELSTEFHNKLIQLGDKIRLAYLKNVLTLKGLSEEIVSIISNDKNPLIRAELFKHMRQLEISKQKEIIHKYLHDSSARIRLYALYETKRYRAEFYSVILELISDEAASIRDIARYILKDYSLNFAEIYRLQLTNNEKIVGSILGLAEVGAKDDLALFEQYIQSQTSKIKLACLIAIHRINTSLSKVYSLTLLLHPIRKIRNKCIEILSSNYDNEVIEKTRYIFRISDDKQKKSILRLYSNIGGWSVIGDLIFALADDDESIQDLAWALLEKWRERAAKLYTKPQPSDIKRALENYHQFDISRTKLPYSREKLWKELPFFLRN